MIRTLGIKIGKILAFASALICVTSLCYGGYVTVDQFKGLQRNPEADKIEDGANEKFSNVYVSDGNVQVVKGRDKLNSTAASDTTVNGMFYYERLPIIIDPTALYHANVESGAIGTSDATGNFDLTNVGCAKNETVFKYGDSCFDCTGAADYLWTADDDAWQLGTDGTIEFWVYFDTVGADQGLIAQNASANDWWGIILNEAGATDELVLEIEVGGSRTHFLAWTWTPAATTWYHVALVKDGTDYEVFIDGTSLGTLSDADPWPNTPGGAFQIAFTRSYNGGAAALYCDCKIDEVRYDNDEALYTTNFTAPTTEFSLEYDSAQSKLIIAESDEIVSYDTDGTNRTTILSGVAQDDSWDFLQVGSMLYMTQEDVGEYKWEGTGTATKNSNAPAYPYHEEYKGFLFACNDRDLEFSNAIGADTSDDETWSASDHYLIGYNQYTCTGLAKTANSLAIFSPNSVQEIYGDDATNFQIRNIINGVGTPSDETIESDFRGDLFFFGGVQGVFKIVSGRSNLTDSSGVRVNRGDVAVVHISQELDSVFQGDDAQIDLDLDDYDEAHAYYDLESNLYFLFIDEHCFIYNNTNDTWSYMPGTKMEASVYAYSASQLDGQAYIMDDMGFLYKNWLGYELGSESGTVTGAPTSSTNTTVVDTLATFNTTGDGLAGSWVVVDNGTSLQYRQISSNTATAITIGTAWDTNPTTADTYYVDHIIPDILTKQYAFVKPPGTTGLQAIDLMHNKSASSQNVTLSWYRDKITTAVDSKTVDFTTNYWDRRTMHANGFWIQVGLRTFIYNTSNTVDPPFDLISYGVKAEGKDVN